MPSIPDHVAVGHSARGGRARAERLSPEARSEIARAAAVARWGSLPGATHNGAWQVGNREIQCAVLEDGTRVLNQETFLTTLGRAAKAKAGTGATVASLPPFLSAANLQEFITSELREMCEAIPYRTRTGGRAFGYNALILPMVCDVYLDAQKAGKLLHQQLPTAEVCYMLVRALARVGVIALVDEATGYQETRAQQELQKILNYYIAPELRQWTRMFPPEFFEEIYRLQGWEYKPGSAKRNQGVGKMINTHIYGKLPPGVLDELRRRNPVTETGYRRHKHHQYLADVGSGHVVKQIASVTTLMRISRNWNEFLELSERAFPPPQQRLPLTLDGDEEAATG